MTEETLTNRQPTPAEVGEFFKLSPPTVTPQINGDNKSKREEESLFNGDFSNIEVWLKHEQFRLKKDNEDSERKLREKNAALAFKFSAFWASFIGLIIILHAMSRYFILTQIEFLTVIGTLTASILTYYLLVIKYIFYRKDGNKGDIS